MKRTLVLVALIVAVGAAILIFNGFQRIGAETQVPLDVPSPVVTITMADGGVVKLELYPQIAPNTVANFVTLIQGGFYDGLTFHRVIPGFMIQGGDPTGTGTGGPGYSIKGEFTDNGFENSLSHERGVISMARASDYNSAGSQFFIMHQTVKSLDGQYAAFGRVTEGMDVVDRIANTPTDASDRPLVACTIKSITVDTLGYQYTVVKQEENQ
jgi:peptidyl-prolyl cis-trans isomerase B (cyclophilin B)